MHTWIKDGLHGIEAGKVEGKRGLEWRIRFPGNQAAHEAQPASAEADIQPINDQVAMAPPATVEAAFTSLQRNYENVQAELKAKRAGRLADKAELGRVHGLLEAAQAALERMRAVAPTVPRITEPQPPRFRWPWQRRG